MRDSGSGEKWDFNENTNYVNVKSSIDDLVYKVWDSGPESVKQEVADVLASVRRDLNKLLIYLYNNPQLWNDKPIAFGIYHAFDIHIPCWTKIKNFTPENLNKECKSIGKLFNFQEMKPNHMNIIGLNKPKKIIKIPVEYEGKNFGYEIAEKRSIFLTVRNMNSNIMHKYSTVLYLAIHEITHTVCNDVRWKKDNHLPPYENYHSFMKQAASECGIL